MLPDRRQRLEEIDFAWNALKQKWDQGFRHLKAFRERKGHCRVPATFKVDGKYPTG